MKMSEVNDIIREPNVYFVRFWTRKSWSDPRDSSGGYTRDKEDQFPETGEPMYQTADKAWGVAKEFATKTKGRFYDIEVVNKRTGEVLPGVRLNRIEE